jgi:hypothetical protein
MPERVEHPDQSAMLNYVNFSKKYKKTIIFVQANVVGDKY